MAGWAGRRGAIALVVWTAVLCQGRQVLGFPAQHMYDGRRMKEGALAELFVISLEQVPGVSTSAEVIERHIAHLRRLDDAGALVMCGPFRDHPGGMVVIRAKDRAEAVAVAQADPFVSEGARRFEVRTWVLANRENGYLGKR